MRSLNGDNRGFALVLTLVVTALMVAVAAELIHQVYVDTALSRGFRDGQQASILAESGAQGGAKLIQRVLSSRDYTSLSDAWSKPFRQEDGNGSLELSVVEESGCINLNGLVLPNGELQPLVHSALKRLGSRLEMPESAWNALADWLDSDDQPRSGGAESPSYLSKRPAYKARNTALSSVRELTLVNGFTPEMAARLKPFVTVFSGQSGVPVSLVNINTAPKEVLAALDEAIDDPLAARIIEERTVQPFKSVGELSRVPGAEALSQRLAGRITVKGTVFRITATGRSGESSRVVESVVRLTGGAPEVLSWQEY